MLLILPVVSICNHNKDVETIRDSEYNEHTETIAYKTISSLRQ